MKQNDPSSEIFDLFERSGMTIADLIRASGKARNTVSVALEDATKVRPSTRHALRTVLLKSNESAGHEPDHEKPLFGAEWSDPNHLVEVSEKNLSKLEADLANLRRALASETFPLKRRDFVGLKTAFAKVDAEKSSILQLIEEFR